MRTLALLLTSLVCSAVSPAQQRTVTLELEDGSVIHGPVLEIYKTRLVVEIGGERRVYNSDQWRTCRFQTVENEAVETSSQDPVPAPAETAAGEQGSPSSDDGTEATAAAPSSRRARASSGSHRFASPWHARKDELQQDYPWLFPTEAYQWVSLSAMLFALLSLASHMSARLSSTDPVSFSRALLFALLLLFLAALEMAFVPLDPTAMTIAMTGSSVLLVLLNRVCYRLSLGGSVVATMLFAVQCGIGYAVLQLLDTTLRQIGAASAV